jgi:hypothetical protein
MNRSLRARIVIVTLAVLMFCVPGVTPPISAQDNEGSSWLVANATYAGVWKTEGANSAPDAHSQLTLGYMGADGNVVLFPEEGKLAIRYGLNPVGAPNHSETNVITTLTGDGFRWGQFDPGRNSAEFTCVVGNDGGTVTCARHAMFNGREFFNNIEMTRVATEGAGPPAAP